METILINKGFEVNLIKNKKFKTFVICLLINRKLIKNETTLNAVLSGVMGQASKEYEETIYISRYLEELYGGIFTSNIVKKGDSQILQFYGEVISTDYTNEIFSLPEKITKLIYEIVDNPLVVNGKFTHSIVENEKNNLKQYIRNKINSKSHYALERCIEKMCEGESFGISGDGYLEKIEDVSEAVLYEHYKKVFSSSKINLMVIGDIDFDLSQLTKDFFGDNNDRPHRDLTYTKRKRTIRKNPKFIHEEINSTQGQIVLGYRSNINPLTPDFYSFVIFNEILGGSGNSRLFVNLREKESLCYTVNSFVYRFSGILIVQAGINLKEQEKTVNLINKQIDEIKNGNISQSEFDYAKYNFCKKIKLIEDSPQSMINFYGTQILLNDKSSLGEFLENSKRVTIDNITEIPNKIHLDTIYSLGNSKV